MIRAAVAFLITGAVAEALVFAVATASSPPRPSPAVVARSGGALFYAFHHVELEFEVPRSLLPRAAAPLLAPETPAGVALAPLAATALVVWLLVRAGRAVAVDVGGTAWVRGLAGATVAIPYALLSFVLSFAVRFTASAPGEAGPSVHPDHLGALIWPLALAAVAGWAGGFGSGADLPEEAWERRVRGALAGGWRMLWVGVGLSFLGLLVLAAVQSHATMTFLNGLFAGGSFRGAVLVVLTLSVVPNIASWVLYPAMGGCTGVAGPVGQCLLSYTHFPRGELDLAGPPFPGGPLHLPAAPPGYLLFLLVPILAALAGGWTAARRRRAAGGGLEGMAVGAGAGVVFAVLSVLTIVLSQAVFELGDTGGEAFLAGTFRAGPLLGTGALLALAWGTAGGAVGGLVQARRARRPVSETPGPPEGAARPGP